MPDLVEIAKISGPHGLKGRIKITPYCDSFEGFKKYSHLIIGRDGEPMEVTQAENRGKFYIIALEGVASIAQVEPLRGQTLYVRREQLGSTAQDEYYWRDLMGLKVLDEEGGTLGEIVDIFSTGSNDVYVVDSQKQYYIPATKDAVKEISLEKGYIVIDRTILEDLLDERSPLE